MATERVELDIPGVTTPSVTDPRDAQIAALVEENNSLRDRVAFLERQIAELEGLEPTR